MRVALALAVLTVALVITGCGGSPAVSSGDNLASGKALFVNGNPESGVASCAACHTMQSAGPQAIGVIGPNLDDAFGPARSEGFALDTFEQVVREQIEIPGVPTDVAVDNVDGESRIAMPSRDDYGFTDEEANNIAFFVATCSGLDFLDPDDPETATAQATCDAVPAAPAPEPPAE